MTSLRADARIVMFALLLTFLTSLAHAITYPRRDEEHERKAYGYTPAQLDLRSRKPLPLLTHSKHTCGKDEHRCVNGMCILRKWICDSLDDCGDYSDEISCHDRYGCPPGRFDCGNGQCITNSFICDGDEDCLNAADESECSSVSDDNNIIDSCRSNEFKCKNLQCIDQALVCNRETDCKDRSDEESCVYCRDYEFACRSRETNRTLKCITATYVCDDVEDCDDGSDEKTTACMRTKSQAAGGKKEQLYEARIQSHKSPHQTSSRSSDFGTTKAQESKRGHGKKGMDERKNESSLISAPSSLIFKMKDARHLVRVQNEDENGVDRDGEKTEADDEDEEKENNDIVGDNGSCHPSQFRCANGQCIPYNYRCDYRDDCKDGSDEQDCRPIIQSFPYPPVHAIPSKNMIKGSQPKSGIDLRVYDSPQTQTAGDDVVFRCRDEGDTRLPVKWSRPQGRLLNNDHKEEEGRLTLYRVSQEDAGIYVCTVIGSNPSVSVTAYLTVTSKVDRMAEYRRSKVSEVTQKDDCLNREEICEGYHQLLKLVDQRKLDPSLLLYKTCHHYKP